MNEVLQEFPDFDLEAFYLLAKRINDFINDPNFAKWSEIIVASVQCNKQVYIVTLNFRLLSFFKIDQAKNCSAEIDSLNLKGVISNNFTDFKAMHKELDKGESFTIKLRYKDQYKRYYILF